jgi:hypothetical protein
MANTGEGRRGVLLLVVLGIIVVVLGAFLLIGVLSGDDTGQIDPQNGDSAPALAP